jgi:prophage regulatory protein
MSTTPNRRLLRLPEVKQKVGLSRTAIYRLIAEGQFPRQVCIGPRTVAWCQDALEAWIEQRIQGELIDPSRKP